MVVPGGAYPRGCIHEDRCGRVAPEIEHLCATHAGLDRHARRLETVNDRRAELRERIGWWPEMTEPDHGDGRTHEGVRAVRVVLAEDHQVVRRGLQLVLDSEPDLRVVAQAGDVVSARALVRQHAPEVLVLDLTMPGGSSLEAIPALREEAPGTQIVVLTMEDDPALVRAARRAGALGYVLKESADADLVSAVRRAAAGEPYLNRQLAARLIAARTVEQGWD